MGQALLWLVFLASFSAKLFFLSQEPLLYNNDAGYYVEHIGEVLAGQYPDVSDPPLAFYYAAFFALFFGLMNGAKIAMALASAGIAFPSYMIARRLSGRLDIALLAAFFAAFSSTNMFMAGDLLKNMLGLFFGAWFMYFIIRASDEFSWRDGALACLSAILMLGSHFSSGAFMVLAAAPFLFMRPAMEWRGGGRLSGESMFCLALLAMLFCGGLAIVAAKGLASGSSVGVLGLFCDGGLNLSIFTEYSVFLLPVFLGIARLERSRLMVFVPWLFAGFLLSQPFFVEPGWQMRFAWNAYVPVAILSAAGLGYFKDDKKAFLGAAAIVCLLSLSGFVRSGEGISPIIHGDEWEGLLRLHEERPGMVFSGLAGGMQQWVAAAGFGTTAEPVQGSFFLVCDSSIRDKNSWYEGACAMTIRADRAQIGQLPVEASFGRFHVVSASGYPVLRNDFSRGPPEDGMPGDLNGG